MDNPRATKEYDFDGESDEDEDEDEDIEVNFADDRTEVPSNQPKKYFGEHENGRTFSGGVDNGNNLMKS